MIGLNVPRLESTSQLLRWAESLVGVLRAGSPNLDGGVKTKEQIATNQNNYSLGDGLLFRLSSDITRTITGLAGGTGGRLVVLANVGAADIIVANESVASAAANRILTGTGADVTLTPGAVSALIYDSLSQRWRFLASASGGGGGGGSVSITGDNGITVTPDPITGAGVIDLDIDKLPLQTVLAAGDLFPFLDISVGLLPSAQRKVTLQDLANGISPLLPAPPPPSGLMSEVPSGTVDGVNNTFTLTSAPVLLMLFKNGIFQRSGGEDYTLAGNTITFTAGNVPQAGDVLFAVYTTSASSLSSEVPAGVINGSNNTFTLSTAPSLLLLWKNGLYQIAGGGSDYVLVGSTITYNAGNIPQVGDVHMAVLVT